MHELVLRIKDPDLCYVFARNARRKGHPELAMQAFRRAVDLRAEQHTAACEVERSALRAIYAYEEVLSFNKGKRTRATGTWQLVNRYGVLPALLKRLHSRDNDEVLPTLQAMGMEDYSFSAVCAAYPDTLGTLAA